MSIAKETKELWREIHAEAQKRLTSVEASFNGNPDLDGPPAFGLYNLMTVSILGLESFIHLKLPKDYNLVWFLKYSLKELDALARKVRRPIMRYASEYTDMVTFVPQLEDGQKPVFYYDLAMEMLAKIKKQTIEDIKFFAKEGEEKNREDLEWLLEKFEQLEEKLKFFGASVIVAGAIEVHVPQVITNNPLGPTLDDLAFVKLIEQFPMFYVLSLAYLVTKMAIGQYYFCTTHFKCTAEALLQSFALAEYIRIYAYEISKQVKIKYYGVG